MILSVRKHGLLILLCWCLSLPLPAAQTPAKNAIASAHPLATEAGMRVLRAGGNAFDAAVTVATVLAVVEPYSAGLGGGGFWLLHRAEDGMQTMVDGRERAPLAAHRDMYLDENGDIVANLSVDGPLAAGIPGQVAALAHINQRYGSRPLQELLQPAIELARDGFAVDAHYQRLARFRLPAIQASPAAARIFLHDGDVPELGHRLRQPQLAETLQQIAEQGHDGFYRGELARQLVDAVRAAGGIWSLEDLAEYRAVEREPVRFYWKGWRITSAALPSSGGIVLAQMLSIIGQFDWDRLDAVQQRHVTVEAMRLAYRDRAEYLGDADHVDVPVDSLLAPATLKAMARGIDLQRATDSTALKPAAVKPAEGHDTTHYSIIDRNGNRVAATLSINYPFGSGFVAGETGILLNDEMDDFSARPGTPNVYGLIGAEANAIAPGKRMLSSMSPSFAENDDWAAIIGTPGGSRIITMVLQGILGLEADLDATTIVSKPRIHHQYLPDTIQYEAGALSTSEIEGLQALGHSTRELENSFGNMQLLIHDKRHGVVHGASDPRGLGMTSID